MTNTVLSDVIGQAAEWVQAVAAIAIAVVTAFYTYFARQQARATEKSAEAAKASADAAKLSADALKNAERAWLSISMGPLPPREQIEPGKVQIFFLSPEVKNVGRTPAFLRSMRLAYHLAQADDGLPTEPNYEGLETERFEGHFLLPPNGSVQPCRIGLPLTGFHRAEQGFTQLFLYGVVSYGSVAGDGHESRFCMSYHVPRGFDPLPPGFMLGGPPAYNRAT